MDILITPRLTLRPPIALDADEITHWLQDWDVVKMLGRVNWPNTIEDAEKWIATMGDPEKQLYTIHRQSLIGVAGFVGVGDTRNLGYWLAKPWHRQGFMREALTRLFDQVFSAGEIATITAGAVFDNPASLKLQESLGFKITGETETISVPRKTKVKVITTVLTRKDWFAREVWLGRAETGFSRKSQPHQQQSSLFTA